MSRPGIVVVGHGIAGLTAADTLRAHGYDGPLTLVGDEPRPAYSRPALSKALLRDADDLTSHQLPPATHEAVELLGHRATGVSTDRRLVQLEGGEELPYDGLVIATGCRPRRLGPPDSGELTLRSLDDALVLRERLRSRPTVVVVGGGPLGMEIASSCVAAGCEVTLVSQGPPLQQQLGAHLSGVLVAAAVEHGLRIVDTTRATVHGRAGHPVIRLAEGGELTADLVVTAAGDLPNTEWLASSGLLTGGVLEVDRQGRLRPDIVAAGDVAAFPTRGFVRRVPLWNSAIERSRVAAASLVQVGSASAGEPLPYFWTEQFEMSAKVMGHLPLRESPTLVDGDGATGSALLRWDHEDGSAAVAAVNYRIPIPKLRRMCTPGS